MTTNRFAMPVLALAALITPAAAGLAGTGQASHTRAATQAPTGRQWESFAYYPPGRDIVLFGGAPAQVGGPVLADTWTWNARGWTLRHPATSPPARTGAAMVYDAATRQLLLFGGNTADEASFLGDTWTWNGATWTKLHPATSPSARHNADMVYDAADHQVILFGGYDGQYLGDTWSWNGTNWTELHPAGSPAPRDTESLVYDPATRTAVMFGGYDFSRLDETWSWDGTNWTELNPADTPGVVSPVWQAAYDTASNQLIIYGGDRGGFSQDTWTWTGATWTKLHPATTAGPRGYGAMTYDPAIRRAVLFGGSDGPSDPAAVEEWDGSTWQPAQPSPCAAAGLVVWLNTAFQQNPISSVSTLNFTNLSGHVCTVRGVPAVSGVDLAGDQLGSQAASPGFKQRTVRLLPGASAVAVLTIVDTSNFPAAACRPVTAAGLDVSPPGSQVAKAVPYPLRACSRSGPIYLIITPVTTPAGAVVAIKAAARRSS